MMTLIVVIGVLILVSFAFLTGTTYSDYHRDRYNRRLAASQRELNARLCPRPELCSHCQHMINPPVSVGVLADED